MSSQRFSMCLWSFHSAKIKTNDSWMPTAMHNFWLSLDSFKHGASLADSWQMLANRTESRRGLAGGIIHHLTLTTLAGNDICVPRSSVLDGQRWMKNPPTANQLDAFGCEMDLVCCNEQQSSKTLWLRLLWCGCQHLPEHVAFFCMGGDAMCAEVAQVILRW